MFGAVAAGKATGGYDLLYDEYLCLHDYFGRGGNDAMKRLKRIKAEALAGTG